MTKKQQAELQLQLEYSMSAAQDSVSWAFEEGVLLTANKFKALVKAVPQSSKPRKKLDTDPAFNLYDPVAFKRARDQRS